MHELERRKAAIEATRLRFAGRPYAWGSIDCVKVGAAHLPTMGHHLTLGLSKAGPYRTALGAKRALARAGHDSVAAAVEATGLLEIPPLALLPADLVVSNGTHGMNAIGIWMGNMALLGFHEDAMEAGLQTIRLRSFDDLRAWRL